MEDVLVDIDDYRQMLADHLDPIRDTIAKIERQQERIVDIIADQAAMTTNISHIEEIMKGKIIEADKMHDEIFGRLRQVEQASGDKLWDVLKLIIAAAFGGIVALLAWLAKQG